MNFKRTKMCAECPFRQNAPAGWLGPWSIDDIESFIRFDQDFACHMDVARLKKAGCSEALMEEKAQHCVGMLRYMNASCKQSREPEKFKAQETLRKVKDDTIIAPWKFREHHSKSPVE